MPAQPSACIPSPTECESLLEWERDLLMNRERQLFSGELVYRGGRLSSGGGVSLPKLNG